MIFTIESLSKFARPLLAALLAGASVCAAAQVQVASVAATPPSGIRLGFDDARHLLVRTGFAATEREVLAFAGLTRTQAVERLLSEVRTAPRTPPPEWIEDYTPFPQVRAMSQEERMAFVREQNRRGIELRGWWLTEMLTTPSPFTERMTLFWHNHFTSSLQKVRQPRFMYRQNLLLRRHALGNFGEMLHAVAKDPAMLIYLDSATNRRQQPNENFAREVMELFTLGEGRYGERDVKEAARAFTGWGIDVASGEFLFRPGQHDDGAKTVLGKTGNFDGTALLDLLLAEPRTADFLAAKLWREFVSPQTDAESIRPVAAALRESRYDIRAALRVLLTTDAFYAPRNRAALIKSPVDLLVGTFRQFGFELTEVTPFVLVLRQLGQDLMAPPNVKGWPGGEAWINSTTLLARKQTLERLFRAEETRAMVAGMENRGEAMQAQQAPPGAAQRMRVLRAMAEVRFDVEAWMRQFARADAESVKRLVLPAAPINVAAAGGDHLDLVRALTLDPIYQLK